MRRHDKRAGPNEDDPGATGTELARSPVPRCVEIQIDLARQADEDRIS
jgi:hypothetical protein